MENNFMGFDDFIYVVKVTEDGEEFTYEYGNPKHALIQLETEPSGKLFRYNTVTKQEFEVKGDELQALTAQYMADNGTQS